MKYVNVRFYPVVHLMTGPPGLFRNGGIWKRIKEKLASVQRPARFMVQAMHFAAYNVSQHAWSQWMTPEDGSFRLRNEISRAFGQSRDVFVDSGGFQLLHADKIDLSRWDLELSCEDILKLQSAFGPTKIASLDSPLSRLADASDVNRLFRKSIQNAVWLAEHVDSLDPRPLPYLAIHGRSPMEVETYLRRLLDELPRGWTRRNEYGFALGSQVPLSSNPELIVANVLSTLDWMERTCPAETPLHVFGVGDGLIGEVLARRDGARTLSYDNSTYVQNAFRLRTYDPSRARFVHFSPYARPACACLACYTLSSYGARLISEVLAKPPYQRTSYRDAMLCRSDILALIALHNLRWWTQRLSIPPNRMLRIGKSVNALNRGRTSSSYRFPLKAFTPRSPCLVLTQCSKERPYRKSSTQRRMINYLAEKGYGEGSEYDRVTLSGLYGPVHWSHEETPPIMSYDFSLGAATSRRHVNTLRVQTAVVLGVIRRRYESHLAYLPNRHYRNVFGPVVRSFKIPVVAGLEEIVPKVLAPRITSEGVQ